MNTDRVLTINDYYDGPRLGVAELNGVPHIYEAEFEPTADEYDDNGDTYYLSPVEPELLALLMEDWAIWCRWHQAHERGQASSDTHPALPVERARYEELKLLIGDRLRSNPAHRQRYKGAFTTPPECRGTWNGTLVEWTRHDA